KIKSHLRAVDSFAFVIVLRFLQECYSILCVVYGNTLCSADILSFFLVPDKGGIVCYPSMSIHIGFLERFGFPFFFFYRPIESFFGMTCVKWSELNKVIKLPVVLCP